MKKGRVLLIGSQPERMTRLKRTYKSLRKLGVNVSVMSPYRKPDGRPRILKGIIRYLVVTLQIALSKADVYHFYNVPDVIGLPLLWKRGCMIYDVRSPWFSSVKETIGNKFLTRIAGFIERIITMGADIVLTANTPLAERAHRWGAQTICVIPNYPTSDFKPKRNRNELRDELKLGSAPTVLYLGKISLIEGSELLKTIIMETCQALKDVTFLIVGDGPQRQSVESFIQNNNLSDRVIMTGWVSHDEVADYINAVDLCVLPRRWDSFSPYATPENVTKAGEYIALGKIAIVPKMGGFAKAKFPMVPVEPEKMGEAVIDYISFPRQVDTFEKLSWDVSHRRLKKIYSHL